MPEVRKREGSALANAIYGEDIQKELRFTCNQFDFSAGEGSQLQRCRGWPIATRPDIFVITTTPFMT
jgi:hypothetical protein